MSNKKYRIHTAIDLIGTKINVSTEMSNKAKKR